MDLEKELKVVGQNLQQLEVCMKHLADVFDVMIEASFIISGQ